MTNTTKQEVTSNKKFKIIKLVADKNSSSYINKIPEIHKKFKINNSIIDFEVDISAIDSFIGESTWILLGKPKLLSTKK